MIRRLLTYFRRRRTVTVEAAVLDPPLPGSMWDDKWTRTADANGWTRVRQGNTGQPGTRP